MRRDRDKKVIAAEADTELVARIDAVLERLRREQPGTSYTRSDAIRTLLLAGLTVVNAA